MAKVGRQFNPIYHGSQGVMLSQEEMQRTLVKPVAKDRYQRGYTPERMAAVKRTLGVDEPGAGEHTFSGPAGRAKMLEAVARSSAPMEALQKKGVELRVGVRPVSSGAEDRGQAGSYHRPGLFGRPAKVNLQSRTPTLAGSFLTPKPQVQREDDEMTLMHELGHHASRMAGTQSYSTAKRRGAEEARADDFAHQYHQRDPRDVRRGLSDQRWGHSYEGTTGETRDPMALVPNEKFGVAYKAQRKVRIGPPGRRPVFEEGQAQGALFDASVGRKRRWI
jgi:hypothetical protein